MRLSYGFRLRIQSSFIQQWAAANCTVLPTANAGQYVNSHCKPLLFWFLCKRRYIINVRTFNIKLLNVLSLIMWGTSIATVLSVSLSACIRLSDALTMARSGSHCHCLLLITSTNVLWIRNWRTLLHMHRTKALPVHSPNGSTFLHEMTLWLPSLTCDVLSKIGLRQSIRIYLKNDPVKFHCDLI